MRRLVLATVVLAAAAYLAPAAPAQERTFTYSIETLGVVEPDLSRFRAIAEQTLSDRRGWTLRGSIAFRRVEAGGDFRLMLADPERIEGAAPVCSDEWSCRVGDMVLINERRWAETPPAWPLSRDAYRRYVINHEVGHWLGLSHRDCPSVGATAPVMQQQSISLAGCEANVWPLAAERRAVGRIHGVELGTRGDGKPWPVPVPEWYWAWARWYLHRSEFEDEPFRSEATRPASAPYPIPEWAWRRLKAQLGEGGGPRVGGGPAKPWPVPIPDWFWVWARWYLHRSEFRDEPFRSEATRPDSAPYPIPDWAWRRLEVLLGRE